MIYTLPFVSYIATVSLSLLQRNVSRQDIDCPGDVISYNCSIVSNSENVHLTWRVTLPGDMPFNVTYDRFSTINSIGSIDNVLQTTLTRFISDTYIESMLEFVLSSNIALNQTKLECLIEELDSSTVIVFVNSSGLLSPSAFCYIKVLTYNTLVKQRVFPCTFTQTS